MQKEILEAQIKQLEKENNIICSSIHARKLELAEMETEKSVAKSWVENELNEKWPIPGHLTIDFCINAHEAGQAHATAATHEIYRPLVERAKNAVIALRESQPLHVDWKLLAQEIKNLSEPLQEEESGIVATADNWEWCNLANETAIQFKTPGNINFKLGCKYKLTPIED